MFTGIIETLGEITQIRKSNPARIAVKCKSLAEQTKPSASISVNGVCLTVTEIASPLIYFDVMAETLRSSNLGELIISEKVNLEQGLQIHGRFDGHIVQGHIDEVGKIIAKIVADTEICFKIQASADFCKLIVQKGSVAIDGISLTISDVDYQKNNFTVDLIPTTFKLTNLQFKNSGSSVNLEADIISKYVKHQLEQILKSNNSQSKITSGWLTELGF